MTTAPFGGRTLQRASKLGGPTEPHSSIPSHPTPLGTSAPGEKHEISLTMAREKARRRFPGWRAGGDRDGVQSRCSEQPSLSHDSASANSASAWERWLCRHKRTFIRRGGILDCAPHALIKLAPLHDRTPSTALGNARGGSMGRGLVERITPRTCQSLRTRCEQRRRPLQPKRVWAPILPSTSPTAAAPAGARGHRLSFSGGAIAAGTSPPPRQAQPQMTAPSGGPAAHALGLV